VVLSAFVEGDNEGFSQTSAGFAGTASAGGISVEGGTGESVRDVLRYHVERRGP
jgi:hypothetical protein